MARSHPGKVSEISNNFFLGSAVDLPMRFQIRNVSL